MEEKVKLNSRTTIYRPEDCIDTMMSEYLNGKVKGTTTYNDDIDQCWKWRKREANIWSGYSNEGKSLFIKNICLAKVLNEKWRVLISAPEDFPPEEFYDDMVHTISGKSTDKDHPNVISEEEYIATYNLIKDSFIFHYIEPPDNTIEKVFQDFKKICDNEQVDIAIIDPLIKFARPKGVSDRDDIYASHVGSLAADFCRTTDTSFHLVMHQLTPTMDVNTKLYPEPSMYRVKGGGSWSDGFDNVLTVWRPKYAQDKFDTEVVFASQKIKKQKLVGIPQRYKMKFDRKTNRYLDFTTDVPVFNFDKFLKKEPLIKRF